MSGRCFEGDGRERWSCSPPNRDDAPGGHGAGRLSAGAQIAVAASWGVTADKCVRCQHRWRQAVCTTWCSLARPLCRASAMRRQDACFAASLNRHARQVARRQAAPGIAMVGTEIFSVDRQGIAKVRPGPVRLALSRRQADVVTGRGAADEYGRHDRPVACLPGALLLECVLFF